MKMKLEITKVLHDESNELDNGEHVIGEKGDQNPYLVLGRKKKKNEKHRELVANGEEVVGSIVKQIDFYYDDKNITKLLLDESNEHDNGEDVIGEKCDQNPYLVLGRKKKKREKQRELVANGEEVVGYIGD
ncbi:hypothetical protein C5167_009885 [Papaver somniferum]|uniref:Uncharacterized protein n=1 Tax=Papaver somniferum TaxID=3469 RepID=A0A4Y7K2K8_PAPSO|nr:hypothetical protein C5167_009885 [Papaver somniferum]